MRPYSQTFNDPINYTLKYSTNKNSNPAQTTKYLNTKSNNKEVKILNHYNQYGDESLARYKSIKEINLIKSSNNLCIY